MGLFSLETGRRGVFHLGQPPLWLAGPPRRFQGYRNAQGSTGAEAGSLAF